jgi:RNA polymerase sigma factor (sigma-70 family)
MGTWKAARAEVRPSGHYFVVQHSLGAPIMRIATDPRRPLACVHALAWEETSDAELLRRYCAGRDQDAFAELVRRNGPLVLRTCRHVVGAAAAAEDVFQATFVVLVRKASRLRGSGSLAGWLHATAVRLAQEARRTEQRRWRREKRHAQMRLADAGKLTWPDVRETLDAELAALPERYQLPLVLCYLQELSYEEAARRVPCSPGALRGRLERGKRLLRQRLARYGLPVAAPLLVLGAPAPLPAALPRATLATLRATRDGAALPPAVTALLGTSRSAKFVAWALAFVLCLAVGFGMTLQGAEETPQGDQPPPPAPTPAANAKADGEQPRGQQVDALGDPLPPGAVARLGTRRFQVSGSVLSLAGGKTLLVYRPAPGADAFLWMDAATGKIVESWSIPQGKFPYVRHVVGISPDGRWALLAEQKQLTTGTTGYGPGTKEKPETSFALYVCDLSQKREVQVLRGPIDPPGFPTSACWFSRDGKRVVTDDGRHVRLWNIETGKQEWLLNRPRPEDFGVQILLGQPLGFSADSAEVIFRGPQGTIYVVDAGQGNVVRHYDVGRKSGLAVLSPDGTAVLMALETPEVRRWDVKTGKELAPLTGHKKPVTELAFSPDGKTLVTRGKDSFVLVRDWPSGKVRRQVELLGEGQSSFNQLIVGDDQTLSLRFDGEQTLRRFAIDSGKPLPLPTATHRATVYGVAVAPDGSVVSVGGDGMLRTWDLGGAKQIGQLRLEHPPANARFGLSPDGKLVAYAAASGSAIVILDRDTGKTVRKIATPRGELDRVEFSPDGRLVAATGPGASAVHVWNAKDGEPVVRIAASKGGWWTGVHFAFTPDAKWLLVTAGERVEYWHTHSWKMRLSFQEGSGSFAVSPDGRMVGCPCLPTVTLWETSTARKRAEFMTFNYAMLAQFSPDSRYLAWTALDGVVEVFDVVQAERVARFGGHEGNVKAFTFSRDGRHLITASEDCTLLVWEMPAIKAEPK